MDNFNISKIGNNEYLQFNRLNEFKNVIHGFTLRVKGKDTEYDEVCSDLNLSKNYVEIKKQVHSNKIAIVNDNSIITEVDGLITNKKNIPLFIRTSDCISIIIYDPIKEVIGNIHSGWRGTLKRIIINGIELMKKEFSSNSEDLLIAMFPSIGKCHFEVDEDVKILFEEEFKDINIDKYITKGEIKEGKQKYYIDLNNINIDIMLNLKVKKENILNTGICTMCENDKFYSHRCKDEERNLTVIEMKGDN